ncbi:uncharacterized protein TM35_001141020 [Trypanosoma theileri]|uniref:Mucin-associated surface protein (MASP) n=1 Tax=Trypanosoma theileri TaxID=67003 RepID=A0A1X0NDR2_9TRYP|nr:uncharacterized protein TM35_001141020 [Trypanosoma theileri]ORC81507.1 hypothetical protein TM35_001141020 [Trypanosoma theileri]
MMMMMMCRVMCVLAVVLCCACGYTMAAAAAVDNDSPSGRGVSRGAVEVSCGAGGALRVRPAAESEWLTCGAGSRVSACGKYADLCRQRTARGAATTTTTTTNNTTTAGQPKAVMAVFGTATDGGKLLVDWDTAIYNELWEKHHEKELKRVCRENQTREYEGINCAKWLKSHPQQQVTNRGESSAGQTLEENTGIRGGVEERELSQQGGTPSSGLPERANSVVNGEGRERDGDTLGEAKASGIPKQEVASDGPVSDDKAAEHNEEIPSTKRQGEDSNVAIHGNQGTPNNTSVNTVTGEDQPTQHSSPAFNVTAAPESKETTTTNETTDTSASGADMGVSAKPETEETISTNETTDTSASGADMAVSEKTETEETNTTTSPISVNTTTETPTTTPSPLPESKISSNIASTMQMKANADSSVSPVWMRTAAPLLIVAVLFSATVY